MARFTRKQFLATAARWGLGAAAFGPWLPASAAGAGRRAHSIPPETAMRKIEDIVIYRDEHYYSCFPSVVHLPDGQLLAAFRRAPNRLQYGGVGNSHVDPNSYLVLVRSRDGRRWSTEPELICAHPLGGSQDPCLYLLADGTLLCASYLWVLMPQGSDLGGAYRLGSSGLDYAFMGGYLVRSSDHGRTWSPPYYPHVGMEWQPSLPGFPLAPYNRGGMLQLGSGRLLFAVARGVSEERGTTQEHLIASDDQGRTWQYQGVIAQDPKVVFNEAQLYETPSGDVVCFMRTANCDDHTALARSHDGGRTWEPWQDTGIIGHPHHLLRLPDGRVWLVYGYRHEPFGIRGRVLDPECTRLDAPEVVLRTDGGGGDIGYPWSCLLPGGKVLTAYYFHLAAEGGAATRFIAGTILEPAG